MRKYEVKDYIIRYVYIIINVLNNNREMTSTTNRMTMKISSTMKTKSIITFSLQQSKKFY